MYRALHYSLSGADGFTKGATLSTRHRLATQGEGPIGRVRGAAGTPTRARTNRRWRFASSGFHSLEVPPFCKRAIPTLLSSQITPDS
jgi:hypothetical protein